MQFVVEIPSPRKHAVWAWSYLEDAYEATLRDVEGTQLVLHLERLLSGALVSLRSACEALFKPQFDKAPDIELVEFVRTARNAVAHATAIPASSLTNAERVKYQWNHAEGKGVIRADVYLTVEVEPPTNKRTISTDRAARYLARHGSNLFRALHAATETVAQWAGAPVDPEFKTLGQLFPSTISIEIQVEDLAKFRAMVDATKTGTGDINLGEAGPPRPHSQRLFALPLRASTESD